MATRLVRLRTNEVADVGCLTVFQGPPASFHFDPEEHVSAEACVRLTGGDELRLEVGEAQLRLDLTRLVVISEARTAEVSRAAADGHREYVATMSGVETDDSDEDMRVYRSEATFDERLDCKSGLRVRLPGGGNDGHWVLAVAVAVEPAKASPPLGGHFDLGRMESMLAGSELSDKAKQFKKIFSDFQRSNTVAGAAMMGQTVGASATDTNAANVDSTSPRASLPSTSGVSLPSLAGGAAGAAMAAAASAHFVTKADVAQLEAKITARLDEQDRKLDRILTLLEMIHNKDQTGPD